MSERPLEGQVALVTGASKGLGRRLVEELVAAGVQVAALARPSASLDRLREDFPDTVAALPCDIRSSEAVNAAIAEAVTRFGQLDIVINNAAACLVNKVEDLTDEDVRTEVETNLLAPIWIVRAAIPHLRRSGRGQVVNVTSESAVQYTPLLAVYASTKAALERFSINLRTELRNDAIRVSVVRSGFMSDTAVLDQWSETQASAFFSHYTGSEEQAQSGGAMSALTVAKATVELLSRTGATSRILEIGG